jgi:hypothetical protein
MNQHSNYIYHHRSIRPAGYDYSQPGPYFVTICTKERHSIFEVVRGGEM